MIPPISTTLATKTNSNLTNYRNYLEALPDVVFIQDGIKEEDLLAVLEEVGSDKYKCQYQVCISG